MPTRHPMRSTTTAALLALTLAGTLSACGLVTRGGEGEVGAGGGPSPSASQEPGPAPTDEPSTPSGSPTTSTSAPTTSGPAPSPSSTPSPPSTPTPSSPSTPSPSTTTAPPVDPNLIKPGAKGPQVLALQNRLTALGYWLGKADGTYGDLTKQAVLALQKSAGIGRDGTYGPATKKVLDAGFVPKSDTGKDGVEIDLETQVLKVVRGGKVTLVLNTSTGSGETYVSRGSQRVAVTPKGSFTTFRSVDGSDVGPLGALWRPRYFNGGIAVHGYTSVPAYPASHGCARVSNEAMNMIWSQELMPIGSRVTVT